MGPVWALARLELRTRWLALVGVGLIVALSTGVVLTAVVGARRTASTVERFQHATAASDGIVQSTSAEVGSQLTDRISALPHVQAATSRFLVNGWPTGADESTPDFAIYSDPTGRYGNDIDAPMVLRGRMPDEAAPDEVLLDELAARVLDLDVGDHVQVATWSADDLEVVGSGDSFPGFNGPPLDLTVVGVGRTAEGLGNQVSRASLIAIAGPGFLGAHPDIGAWPPVVALRVDDPRNVATVADEITALGADDAPTELITSADSYLDSIQHSVDALSTGLWIFALVAGAAALITVGQAMSRQVAAATSTTEATRALGLTRGERARAGALPTLVVSVAGVAIGVVLAVAWSPILPTGAARRIEVQPGTWVDGRALLVGALSVIALVGAWVYAVSWRAQRRDRSSAAVARRPSAIANRLAGWGAAPALVTGVRNTFEGRGRLSVPVRSALVAMVVAVAGVVVSPSRLATMTPAPTTPARWGWTWSSQPDAFDGDDPTDQLVHDDRLDAVAIESSSQLLVDDHQINTSAIEPLRGSMNFTVLSGRLPLGPSEIALGKQAERALDVTTGDVLHGTANGSSFVDLTVVGVAIAPSDGGPGATAIMTTDGLQATEPIEPIQTTTLLRYPAGADPGALERQLADDYGLTFSLFSHAQVPGPVTNVDQGRGVAVALAIFFTLLGVASLVHALTLSTRRRRSDFAVLRAMGFRRAQVRESVLAQALTMAIVGLVIGVPVGLIVGRGFWNRLVGDLEVLGWPATPWLVMALVVPAALVLAALVAWFPARVAARAPTGQILRGD